MNSRTWAVWINNTVRWYENNYLYVQRRRSVVDVSAVALRLFDVARCRRRHAHCGHVHSRGMPRRSFSIIPLYWRFTTRPCHTVGESSVGIDRTPTRADAASPSWSTRYTCRVLRKSPFYAVVVGTLVVETRKEYCSRFVSLYTPYPKAL